MPSPRLSHGCHFTWSVPSRVRTRVTYDLSRSRATHLSPASRFFQVSDLLQKPGQLFVHCSPFWKPSWHHLVYGSVPHISCKWKWALELWLDSGQACWQENSIGNVVSLSLPRIRVTTVCGWTSFSDAKIVQSVRVVAAWSLPGQVPHHPLSYNGFIHWWSLPDPLFH